MTRNRQGIHAYKQAVEKTANPSSMDKEALFERYKKRIYQIAHRLMEKIPANHPLEFEDMVSYGAIGLLEAIERF